MEADSNNYKTFLLGLIGAFLLILGVTLILNWWQDVVILFRGVLGVLLAIAGLAVLYFLSKK